MTAGAAIKAEATETAQTLHAQAIAATSTTGSTDLSTTPTTASSSPRPGLWARIREAIRG